MTYTVAPVTSNSTHSSCENQHPLCEDPRKGPPRFMTEGRRSRTK